jgi:hypothetical protein
MPAEHRAAIDSIDKTKLRDFLDQRFSQTDLENLCLNLSERLDETITLETVDTSGQGKLHTILKLIEYTENRGWLKHLVSETHAARKELFDAAFGVVIAEADTSDAQERYREMIRERWSRPRYQLDEKFVNLTLTLDKGEQADERFAEDTRKFADLREAWKKKPRCMRIDGVGQTRRRQKHLAATYAARRSQPHRNKTPDLLHFVQRIPNRI